MFQKIPVEVKRQARHADLYDYLVRVHPLDVTREGRCLRLKSNPGVVLKKGFCGYNDYVRGTTGNSLDLLANYLGYSFMDAVEALAGRKTVESRPGNQLEAELHPVNLPLPAEPPFTRAYAYLTKTRGLPALTIQRLIDAGLLYQETNRGNVVFVNRERDYCEIRGTLTYKPFHGCQKSRSDNYWSFGRPTGNRPTAYICEAAIDAVSLYEILRARGPVNAIFCSIGGVANQKTITRIAEKYSAILAVDNDDAGKACLDRNPSLPFIQPTSKDWNQDWLEYQQKNNAG